MRRSIAVPAVVAALLAVSVSACGTGSSSSTGSNDAGKGKLQTGPGVDVAAKTITIGDINTGPKGEEVFSERISLIFKSLAVRRIFDKKNDTLIYVIYSRQVKDASAKMAISTVPLFRSEVTWAKDKK